MQTLDWLEDHVGSLAEGIERANLFHWSLSVQEIDTDDPKYPKIHTDSKHYWFVKGGEAVIFSTDSREALDAFLYGLSLAYSVIPDPLFDQLVKATDEGFE